MAQQNPLKHGLVEGAQDDDSAMEQPSVAGYDAADATRACELQGGSALRALAPGGLQDAAQHSDCEFSRNGFATTCTDFGAWAMRHQPQLGVGELSASDAAADSCLGGCAPLPGDFGSVAANMRSDPRTIGCHADRIGSIWMLGGGESNRAIASAPSAIAPGGLPDMGQPSVRTRSLSAWSAHNARAIWNQARPSAWEPSVCAADADSAALLGRSLPRAPL